MCEFCMKHGEGEKWYLQAKNYAADLLSDVRRRKLIERFSDPEKIKKEFARGREAIDRIGRAPRFVKNIAGCLLTRKMKKVHFGQVVPIEEIEKIFGFTNSIIRTACICRHTTIGKEKRYCYGVSMAPDGGILGELFRDLDRSFAAGPHSPDVERLTAEEAVAALHDHEGEGLCHTVWTFQTPFIGAICNCDRSGCMALRTTVTHEIPVMFRAEYVARIDEDLCVGCRECLHFCQFGGITYSAASKRAVIDEKWCYGCGVCRAGCAQGAISLIDRNQSSTAANLW